MYNKTGFKTKKNTLISRLFVKQVLAEEPTSTEVVEEQGEDVIESPTKNNDNEDNKIDDGSHSSSTTINYEDLITKARKEEKGKLYPKINQLESDKKKLIETNNNQLITIEKKDRKIEELQQKLKDAEKSDDTQIKSLKEIIKDLESQIEKLKTSQVDVESLEKEIKDQYDVKLYRMEKVHSEGNSIIPELVTGTTKEEIDASLVIAKERFNQIQENIMKTSGLNKIPSANVDTSKFDLKEFSIDDLASMDVNSPEYRQVRAKLGLK